MAAPYDENGRLNGVRHPVSNQIILSGTKKLMAAETVKSTFTMAPVLYLETSP